MVNKFLLGAALASAMCASSAQAATLLFTITDEEGSTFETFTLDENAGIENAFNGYLFFHLLSSSRGNNGAYFGSPARGNNFGTGIKRGGEFSAEPTYDDRANVMVFSGEGLLLNVGSGDTFTTMRGYTVAVSTVAGVPEPSAWAMLILGFGVVGGTLRSAKRKKTTTVSFA